MKNNKLAKDIAFAKERAKYRKQIWELKSENCILANTVMDLNGMLQKHDEKIAELQDWIERLLENIRGFPKMKCGKSFRKIRMRWMQRRDWKIWKNCFWITRCLKDF